MPPPERHPLLRFGRLLPRSLRTRVFEPAFYDLIAEDSTRGEGSIVQRARRWLKVALLAVDTLRVGGLRLLWTSAQRSWRIRVATILLILLLVTLALLKTNTLVEPGVYVPITSP